MNEPFRVVLEGRCPACAHPVSARTGTHVTDAIADHEAAVHSEQRGALTWPVSRLEFYKRDSAQAEPSGRE